MTHDEAYKAASIMFDYAAGKAVQYRSKQGMDSWLDITTPGFNWSGCSYRIKPEVVRYRRWLERTGPDKGYVQTAHSDIAVATVPTLASFVRWIDTEWQEVEV